MNFEMAEKGRRGALRALQLKMLNKKYAKEFELYKKRQEEQESRMRATIKMLADVIKGTRLKEQA